MGARRSDGEDDLPRVQDVVGGRAASPGGAAARVPWDDDPAQARQEPPPPAPRRRRRVLAWAAVGVLGVAVVGTAIGGDIGSSDTRATVPAGVTSIEVRGGSNDVELRTSATPNEVDVEMRRAFTCRPSTSVEGTVLVVDASCDAWRGGDAEVTVPALATVNVTTQGGDVEVDGRYRQLSVAAASGNVDLDASGNVRAETESGDIRGKVSGPYLTATTDSGDVEVFTEGVPQGIDVRTGSGDAALDVPGRGEYRVDATTTSGDRDVQVDGPADAPNWIRVRTGSGDVEVRGS